jgi:probable phosphoglycerate mutase
MPTIWLIRHAESAANAGLPTLNPVDIELTARGWQQAEQIAQAFTAQPGLIVTSPYMRARQTAHATLLRFPDSRLEDWPVHEFTYLSTSDRHYTTTHDRRPLVRAFWKRCDPYYVDGTGAESFISFMSRTRDIIERLKHHPERFIAVFSHEQFIHAMLWLLFIDSGEVSPASMYRFRHFLTSFTLPNGAILKVQLSDKEMPWLSPVITAHLSRDCHPATIG